MAVSKKRSSSEMASSVIMPRRSIWLGTAAVRRVCWARATILRASRWVRVSPSTTRTSSCLAEIFKMPACNCSEPSLFTDSTVAFVPMDTSSTVSPATAGRVGGGASVWGAEPPRFRSASLSIRRASATFMNTSGRASADTM